MGEEPKDASAWNSRGLQNKKRFHNRQICLKDFGESVLLMGGLQTFHGIGRERYRFDSLTMQRNIIQIAICLFDGSLHVLAPTSTDDALLRSCGLWVMQMEVLMV